MFDRIKFFDIEFIITNIMFAFVKTTSIAHTDLLKSIDYIDGRIDCYEANCYGNCYDN